MVTLSAGCGLHETRIIDLCRQVHLGTRGQIDSLRIAIVNEEEIVLAGSCRSIKVRLEAQRALERCVPGAKVHNALRVAVAAELLTNPPSHSAGSSDRTCR